MPIQEPQMSTVSRGAVAGGPRRAEPVSMPAAKDAARSGQAGAPDAVQWAATLLSDLGWDPQTVRRSA